MAILFDHESKRIVLDVATITATDIYSRWVDWVAIGDNSKHLPAFRYVGGDDLGSGISIPPYFFLQNGWRIRPMEASHTLTVSGNLFVEGGGDPIVGTIGAFNVLIRSIVPVQAQVVTINSGAGIGTVDQVRDAVWSTPVTSLTDTSTIGGFIHKLVMTVPKFLGYK